MSLPISIIVPVYNAGVHFTTLLDSILAQTFTQFELILVLDCPTDGSDKVAKRYAQNDKRIVIVENEHNLHIGFSRNKGLQLAKGNYIAFADHDDYVQPTWLETLYNKALETDADVVVCNFKETDGTVERTYALPDNLTPNEMHQEMLQSMVCSIPANVSRVATCNVKTIWCMLYKASIAKNVSFCDNRKVAYEDALYNMEIFMQASKVEAVSAFLYVHILHDANSFAQYVYKSEPLITAYLHQTNQLVQAYNLPFAYVGEGVVRRYFVCLFNEYKHQGLWATISLLFRLRNHPFKAAVKAFRKTKPALSVAKKIFLFWLS